MDFPIKNGGQPSGYVKIAIENHRKMVVEQGLMGFHQENGGFNGIYPAW